MGIKLSAEKLHLAEFFSVPYVGGLKASDRLHRYDRNLCKDGRFDFSISKDEQGNLYVDVNPADQDGFEYKVDISKKLFRAFNDRWIPANWSNESGGVKDVEGGKDVAYFSDTYFVRCIEKVAIDTGLYSIPYVCRKNDNKNDRVSCVQELTGSLLGYGPVGIFLSAYAMALPPG